MQLDPRAWLAWVAALAVVSSVTRNPLYLILALLIAVVVERRCAAGERSLMPFSPFRFALIVLPLAAGFNALMVHAGETVLFRLPAGLPVVGGPVTAEALAYGAINGLALTALFAAFTTLNRVVPVHELVKLTPRAFHEAGVVVSIALTFLPQMTRMFDQVRQAQAIRGHRPRGVRDWLPIMLPLLIGGLERAMGLAEAMVARGYGAVRGQAQGIGLRLGLALGLLAVLSGWVANTFLPPGSAGGLAMAAGGAIIVAALWYAGRGVRHTQYRPRRWRWSDTLVLLGCGLALLVLAAPLPGLDRSTVYYYPYPRLQAPAFDPLLGLGLLGLLLPASSARSGD